MSKNTSNTTSEPTLQTPQRSLLWDFAKLIDTIDRVIKLGNAARATMIRRGLWSPAKDGPHATRDEASVKLGALTKVAGSIRYNAETGVVNGPVRDFMCKPISEAAFMDIYGDVASALLHLNTNGRYADFLAEFKQARQVDFDTVVLPRFVESYLNFQAFCDARQAERNEGKPPQTSREVFDDAEEVSVY